MNRRRPVVAAMVLGVALAVAGCTDPSPEPLDPLEDQSPTPEAEEAEPVEEDIDPEFNDDDVAGAQEILAMHHISLELHEIIQSKADIDQNVHTLSLMHTTHFDQIRLLEEMLGTWDAEVPDAEEARLESEVVSDEQVRELGRVAGDEASALYLELMITLHEARSSTCEDVLHDGENPDLADLAQGMLTDQQQEVTHMRELLAGLDTGDADEDDDAGDGEDAEGDQD